MHFIVMTLYQLGDDALPIMWRYFTTKMLLML